MYKLLLRGKRYSIKMICQRIARCLSTPSYVIKLEFTCTECVHTSGQNEKSDDYATYTYCSRNTRRDFPKNRWQMEFHALISRDFRQSHCSPLPRLVLSFFQLLVYGARNVETRLSRRSRWFIQRNNLSRFPDSIRKRLPLEPKIAKWFYSDKWVANEHREYRFIPCSDFYITYIYTHTYIYIYIHVYIYVYIYIYMYVYRVVQHQESAPEYFRCFQSYEQTFSAKVVR